MPTTSQSFRSFYSETTTGFGLEENDISPTVPSVPSFPALLQTTRSGRYSDEILIHLKKPYSMLSYSTKAPPLLGKIALKTERILPSSRLFGIELETIVKTDAIKIASHKIMNSLPFLVITKPDSSIGERGIEIVSAPATLAAHRIMWTTFFFGDSNPKHWSDLLAAKSVSLFPYKGIARSLESYKSPKCGTHIHVSSASIGLGTLNKLWRFVNSIKLDKYLSRIAGREINKENSPGGNRYCPQTRTRLTDAINWEISDHSPHRYAALNITLPETIEFRIFRGNAHPLGFMKNLDFTASIIEFCEQASLQDGAREYLYWITRSEQKRSFPFLNRWLRSHRSILSSFASF